MSWRKIRGAVLVDLSDPKKPNKINKPIGAGHWPKAMKSLEAYTIITQKYEQWSFRRDYIRMT
jgi:hypothetical protein